MARKKGIGKEIRLMETENTLGALSSIGNLPTQAIAFQTATEPARLVILAINSINSVVCETPGSPTTIVNGLAVRGTIEEVLTALGWSVKPVEKIPAGE